MLAQAYYTLTLKNTVAAIMTFNIIGCACTAFIATLGPKVRHARASTAPCLSARAVQLT